MSIFILMSINQLILQMSLEGSAFPLPFIANRAGNFGQPLFHSFCYLLQIASMGCICQRGIRENIHKVETPFIMLQHLFYLWAFYPAQGSLSDLQLHM